VGKPCCRSAAPCRGAATIAVSACPTSCAPPPATRSNSRPDTPHAHAHAHALLLPLLLLLPVASGKGSHHHHPFLFSRTAGTLSDILPCRPNRFRTDHALARPHAVGHVSHHHSGPPPPPSMNTSQGAPGQSQYDFDSSRRRSFGGASPPNRYRGRVLGRRCSLPRSMLSIVRSSTRTSTAAILSAIAYATSIVAPATT